MKGLILGSMLLSTFFTTLQAQDNGKISGYVFGDYYYVVSNHDEDLEGSNGFWLRRIYLGYDRNLSEAFSTRLRLEMNSAGDFATNEKLTPVVKDAYLRWKHNEHSVYLGISSSPIWGLIEDFWGYRAVEKTPLDLQRFGSSRDFGVAVKGKLDSGKRVSYHVMFGNGSSNGSENNDGKKVMLSLSTKASSGLLVEGYVDFEDRPGDANRYTLQGFAGYESDDFRLGVQFAHQNRQTTGDDVTLQLGSVFAVAKLSEKTWGYARIDRQFDANPEGARIEYIPFDATAKSTFLLAGIDYAATSNVHFMPNIEAIVYSGGTEPDSDVIPRFTFYYSF